MVLEDQEFSRHLLEGKNGLFSHQIIEQPFECSNDELSLCKSASGLFLCMLIDKQEFHLENVHFVSQNKILSFQDLSSQTLFFFKKKNNKK
jgi:hypothetical protein